MLHPAFAAHQRLHWMRPDAARWLRPDAATFLKPGSDPADVYPALAREREITRQAHDRAFDVALADERAVLDGLRSDLAQIKSDLAWRRLVDALARKYSSTQPRVPAGQTGGGQWTSGGSGSGRPRVIINTTDFDNEDAAGDEGFEAFDGDDDFFSDEFEDDASFDDTDNSFDTDGSQSTGSFDSSRDRAPADRRPTGITDTRVISDADPEVVRPGESYAQLNKIRDAAGRPYYAPGGHHEMPKAVFDKLDLSPETRRVFDSATTGRLPGSTTVRNTPDGTPLSHGWNEAHRDYSKAVRELSDSFMERNAVSPRQMTPSQAEQLLGEIRSSQDPKIRDYNRAMRMLHRVFRFRSGRSE